MCYDQVGDKLMNICVCLLLSHSLLSQFLLNPDLPILNPLPDQSFQGGNIDNLDTRGENKLSACGKYAKGKQRQVTHA